MWFRIGTSYSKLEWGRWFILNHFTVILVYPGQNCVLNILRRKQIHIQGLKAFLIKSCVEGFAESVLIRPARLDELVFDPSEGKKTIESGLSEFGAIVGTKDPWAGIVSDRVFETDCTRYAGIEKSTKSPTIRRVKSSITKNNRSFRRV